MKDRLTLVWVITGGLAVLLPLTIWGIQRLIYFARFGADEYIQERQQNYEQGQQYYQQQNQNYWRYYWNGYYNVNEQTLYQKCFALNWPCRVRQYRYATYGIYGNQGNDEQHAPLWYIFLGGRTEAMDEWEEKNGHESHAGTFVYGGLGWSYLLTVGLFISLLVFGVSTFKKQGSIVELRTLIVATGIIALLNMIMSVGLISSDEEDLEKYYYGWYGQMGVLMVYTSFWIMFFSLAFFIFFKRFGNESIKERRARQEKASFRSQVDYNKASFRSEGDYHNTSDSSLVVIT